MHCNAVLCNSFTVATRCVIQRLLTAACCGRGDVVEEVASPLVLGVPLLLVKPPVGLATPTIFKAPDLGARSTSDPRQLLNSSQGSSHMAQG